MGKEKDTKINHTVYNIEDVGQVQIADEVVAVIAGLAATEVEGVAKMSGNITNEIVSKLGMKKLSKGVKVTITGKDSFAGSTKEVYFKIDPDTVGDSDFVTTKQHKVTVNTANNYDASLYKDAMGLEFKTDLDSDATKKLTLTYDKDYTVKYYYVHTSNPDSITSEAAIKAAAGTNVPGDYVFAVATLTKDGNYTKKTGVGDLIAYSRIEKKSISNVSVTVEKSSYTFTGEEIAADVVVKDGSVTLDKGQH